MSRLPLCVTPAIIALLWLLGHGAGSARAADSQPANPWPKLTDAQQKDAIAQLKQFALDAQTKLDLPLQTFETKYFLFCSDLAPRESQMWAGLLDRMYVQLARMFAVPNGQNLWRGKALVFVFSRKEDYRKYERAVMHTNPSFSAGMCHGEGNGTVKIAFYRQEDQLEFAHLLVHESVHGFLHRYRSPEPIPSWANEGLAETIASDLVPRNGHRDEVKTRARDNIQAHKDDLGAFFTGGRIEPWQYPVAEMLCTFMIQAGRSNYVAFINGMKDGLSWNDALAQKYQAPLERLVPVFGNWLGVRGLKAQGP